MTYDEFLGQVRQRAHLSSNEKAERATRVVLETLAERLAGEEPLDLASQLPPEIGRPLERECAGVGNPFSVDDFFQLVSIREEVDLSDAMQHARAVVSVLSDAVSPGELRDMRAQLPREYHRLFVGSEGAMPRSELHSG
jgi:uncharacterized protein (DUF2267 family)